MPKTLKLAYCDKCDPIVPISMAHDYSTIPKHVDPKMKSMHEATIIEITVDVETIIKAGETPSVYLSRMLKKHVTNKTL